MSFGIDETQKVMLPLFIACVPFIYSDTVSAIASVPDRYIRNRADARRVRMADHSKVLVPLALPEIYNGLRHLFGLAFGYIMLAEVVNTEYGLGQLLMDSQRQSIPST